MTRAEFWTFVIMTGELPHRHDHASAMSRL